MERSAWRVEGLPGHPRIDRNRRRGVAFLICAKDSRVTSKEAFEELSDDAAKKLHTGIDYWLAGTVNPRLFQGWNKNQFGGRYTNCFVFKCRDDKQAHRFYGLLCNPNAKVPRFQLCVLITHETKDENETDETVLQRIESFRTSQPVVRAIADYVGSLSKEFEV